MSEQANLQEIYDRYRKAAEEVDADGWGGSLTPTG